MPSVGTNIGVELQSVADIKREFENNPNRGKILKQREQATIQYKSAAQQ